MSNKNFHMRNVVLVTLTLSSALAGAARADDWRKIDFDADLTTYLVDVDHIQHTGDSASVFELNVPGRTSIATGAESHTMFERQFDCAKGTERLGDIFYHRNLADHGQQLSHPDSSFSVRHGSLDEIMFNMACHGVAPPSAAGYSSVEQAVHRAFMDAIKLPAEQSVRMQRPFEPPGNPIVGSADSPLPR
ncbi:MAG: hypothetical protein ABSE43_05665 [Steroidobacteraceae bacterium]|jgi:hypothetical protein